MNRLWGYLSIIVATVFFGIWNTFNKLLLDDLDPITITALVYSIAGLFLFLIHFSPLNNSIVARMKTPHKLEEFKTSKDYLILISASIIGTVIAPLLFLTGLELTTAVNASLLMNVETLFIIIIGILFLREKFKYKDIAGFVLIILGALFFTTNGSINSYSNDLGGILIILSAFFWSIDNALNKFLSYKKDILFVTALKCALGGGILVIIALIMGFNFYVSFSDWPLILFLSVFGVGITLILIYFAMRIIGATRTGTLYSLASLFGAIFAFLILNEPFSLSQLSFGLLMLLGVYIFYLNSK